MPFEPVAMPLVLSVPVDRTKYVPRPFGMSSQTVTDCTNAFPLLNATVTDSGSVGKVSRFALTVFFIGAALASQHCGQNAQAFPVVAFTAVAACAVVYGVGGTHPEAVNSLRFARKASSPICA